MSIAENISLGSLPMTRLFGVLPSIDRKRMREEAKRYLDQLNFTADLDQPVQSLSFAERQLVAIAKALRLKCRIFILDEPTAALEDREIERLFGVLERMKKNGTAIIYISHRLDEIRDLADRCTVLRDGKLVSVRARGTFTIADLISDMTGKMAQEHLEEPAAPGHTLIEETAERPDRMSVRKGETIGLAGLLGSGIGPDRAPAVRRRRRARANPPRRWPQRTAVEALRRDRGRYRLRAGRTRARPRHESVGARQYPAAERQARQSARSGSTAARAIVFVRGLMEILDIRPRRPELPVGSLSGGNQQKVILAKWIARQVSVLLLDEPTHGIDIAAKMQVHALIRKFTRDGGGVIASSSDLSELARICDSVLTIRDRAITGRIERKDGKGGNLDEAHLRASIAGTPR